MLGSMKFKYVILALLMSMAMMIAMAGPVTAGGYSNPAHEHATGLTHVYSLSTDVASNDASNKLMSDETMLVADKETDNISSYNKSDSPQTFADSGSGYLYKRYYSGTAQHSNRHVLVVSFKHRAPSDGWDDVKRQ